MGRASNGTGSSESWSRSSTSGTTTSSLGGVFRVRGDIIEVFPSYDEKALRIELFGDEVDGLVSFNPITGQTIRRHDKIAIYPKSHFVMPRERTVKAVDRIRAELAGLADATRAVGQVA